MLDSWQLWLSVASWKDVFRGCTGSTLLQESLQCNRTGVFSTEYLSCKNAPPLPAQCCLLYTNCKRANKLEWHIQISAFTTGKSRKQIFHHGIHTVVFKYIITISRQVEAAINPFEIWQRHFTNGYCSTPVIISTTLFSPPLWITLVSLTECTPQAGKVAGQRKQILALYDSTMKVISHILALII